MAMAQMTPRQRIMTVLHGGIPDRVAFTPNIWHWFAVNRRQGTLPEEFRDHTSPLDVLRSLGVDILARGGGPVIRFNTPNVAVTERRTAHEVITEYETPKGRLSVRQEVADDSAETVYRTEHLFKSIRDLPAVQFLVEDTVYTPCYERWTAAQDQLGEAGVMMATGLPDSPLHRLFVSWMGYERACYALADYPDEMGRLMGLMTERNQEAFALAAASPAELFWTGENTNADFESPALFRQWVVPSLRSLSDKLHAVGKLHIAHM